MSHSSNVDHVPLPPAYEFISDNEDAQTSTSSPPRYSRRPLSGCSTVHIQTSVKEFTYNHDTVTLTINGDASLSEEIPTVVEGGKITGSVRLCWNKGQKVRDVTVSVRGRILTGVRKHRASDVYTFLSLPVELWTRCMGRLYPTNESVLERRWSFSIPLPKEVTVASTGGLRHSVKVCRLPNSFTDPSSPAHVVYDVLVRAKRKPWQRDWGLSAQFVYCQGNRSHLTSLSRTIDDVGWKTYRSVVLNGTLFRVRDVEVRYALSLATPMCYNLGTPICLFLVIKSEDRELLDILANPESIVVRLERRVRYQDVQMHAAKSMRWLSAVDQLVLASWKPTQRQQEPTRRFMRGELRVEDDMCPSINILNIVVEYMVTMYAFCGSGFRPHKLDKSGILLSEPVEITTALSGIESRTIIH
ncbi:hypothetical protein PM082_015833 [Marasmius tenuissimus]|nr:hypothetical protein PM082_015833 [Marasmius tenuissimus]